MFSVSLKLVTEILVILMLHVKTTLLFHCSPSYMYIDMCTCMYVSSMLGIEVCSTLIQKMARPAKGTEWQKISTEH